MADIKDITKMSEEELREEFTKDELIERVRALELVENPEEFTTKGQLIQVLRLAGRKRPSSAPDQHEKDLNRYEAKKAKMREHLEGQPKVNVFLSITGKEKKGTIVERVNPETGKMEEYRVGAWLPVTINGVKTWVPKGVSVEVPKQVAQIIGQYQSKTAEALSRYLIEGDDQKADALAG